jgi:heme oxygenase
LIGPSLVVRDGRHSREEPDVESPPLSLQLREGTKDAHVRAERSSFMQAFLRGAVSHDAYRELLARLLPVYEALERDPAALASHPALSRIHCPELFRAAALRQDLAFHCGPDWSARVRTTPAVQAYVGRLEWLAAHWPVGLAAHHYTRYLGDLSGGQMIARVVRKAFASTGREGVAFYEFPDIPDIPAFKVRYREGLDAMPLAEGDAARLVEEANRAFDLNVGLFSELDALRTVTAEHQPDARVEV